MRLLLSWLRDFVDVPVAPSELAMLLSMRGFEVAMIESAPEGPIRPDPRSPHAPGLAAAEADAVIDLEITANRPDCMGVAGLAREVATIFSVPLRSLSEVWPRAALPDGSPRGSSGQCAEQPELRVTIEDPEGCPRYAAAVARVQMRPSPAWLARRLEAAGIRPISLIVDITNYVLVETGHPMHAFDLARLDGREIRVRRARPGERIQTLDGELRDLDDTMIVIADRTAPQAVAGVMGGAGSEVSWGTTEVAFESAYFAPTSVRRTSRRLGLKTEASARFERGADIAAPPIALARALALMEALGAGVTCGVAIDCCPRPRAAVQVPLRHERLTRLLGMSVPAPDVRHILGSLNFVLEETSEGWLATVPTARIDVTREVDLIEEVARHVGYDRLPATIPPLADLPPAGHPNLAWVRRLRRVLTAAGFFEAQTYAFQEEQAARAFAGSGEAVAISYPLSEKFAVLRPSLIPGLVDAVTINRNRGTRDIRLFEVGSVFDAGTGEQHRLGLVWTGAAVPEHWSGGTRDVDFFDIKGVVERVCEALELAVSFEPVTNAMLVAGRAASVWAAGRQLGAFGQLVPELAASRGCSAAEELYVAEFDLDAALGMVPAEDVHAAALPRFPMVVRDVALLVAETVPAGALRATIRKVAPATLVDVREFDRYQGKGIPEGHVSVAFHLTFRAADRTLTDSEVQAAVDHIVARLAREHRAVQR